MSSVIEEVVVVDVEDGAAEAGGASLRTARSASRDSSLASLSSVSHSLAVYPPLLVTFRVLLAALCAV